MFDSLSQLFGGTISAASNNQGRPLNPWGNALGLMPQVGDAGPFYGRLTGEFEAAYRNLTSPPEVTPDTIVALTAQGAMEAEQARLVAQYRKLEQASIDRQITEYKAVMGAQTHLESQARSIQDTNLAYTKQAIQGGSASTLKEAEFGGWLAAQRQAINRSQSFVSFT